MGKAVVIDGPAGSGKSTTAIELAKKLGFIYLDTGAMYRAITLKFLNAGISDFSDGDKIEKILSQTTIDIRQNSDNLSIFLDGRDVTGEIRANEVDGFVSEVSAVDKVREFMHIQQRDFAKNHDIVAEGRDLGTFVFPGADVKIFLVADLDVRARRRMLQKKASEKQLEEFKANLAKRDRIDSSRSHSPLKKADDAIEVDTSDLSIDQQVETILSICHQKIA